MTNELYKEFRPKLLKHVVGQPEAVETLQRFVKNNRIPHAILFDGPSGCGKTTLARILAAKLKAEDKIDLFEINTADFTGIATIRDIRVAANKSAMVAGGARVWIIDECHMLSYEAQNALLKLLEDPPKHVWILLASTRIDKLIAALVNRCTTIKLKAINNKVLYQLIERIAKKKSRQFSEEVIDRIVDIAEGSARRALVVLNQVFEFNDEDEQLNVINASDFKAQAYDLFKALMYGRKWADVAKILKVLDKPAEELRHYILACARGVLLAAGKGAPRASLIISCFMDNFFDGKEAALANACYEVVMSRK